MKYIWHYILILVIHTTSGESIDDERTPSGELHLIFEEQKPTAMLEKCSYAPNEPVLTPIGVVNPFLQCIKGNSEMNPYISLEDQQKPVPAQNPPTVQEEVKPEPAGTFDDNSADPYESSDELKEGEINEFLKMIETNNKSQSSE
jgi:hypothetical protein